MLGSRDTDSQIDEIRESQIDPRSGEKIFDGVWENDEISSRPYIASGMFQLWTTHVKGARECARTIQSHSWVAYPPV